MVWKYPYYRTMPAIGSCSLSVLIVLGEMERLIYLTAGIPNCSVLSRVRTAHNFQKPAGSAHPASIQGLFNDKTLPIRLYRQIRNKAK
jgi:hypothetical protein